MDKETIIKRLADFGYTYTVDDEFALGFTMEKVENHILISTNQSSIPEGLKNVAVDMVCGEFLLVQKQFGKLEGMDFELLAHNIKLGDMSVQFSNEATPEQQFETAARYLINGHSEDLLAFRKLVW